MSEADTQPVVTTTEAQPQVGAEGTDARNDGADLDTLLKVYDEKTTSAAATTTQTQPDTTAGTEPDLKTVAAKLQQLESFATESHNLRHKQDMGETVKAIRGDLDPDVFDEKLIEGWLNVQAQQDPRLAQAWLNRAANPKQFEQVKTALAKSFQKKFSKLPDRQTTEDRDAVTAAVRGSSTRATEGKAPEFGKMSNADFQKEKDKLFGT